MRRYLNCLAIVTVFSSWDSAVAQESTISSAYTGIASKACVRRIDDAVTGARTSDCPGVHGFRLQVLEDDERSSVSVVTPDGRVLPLNYWDVVTRGFSTLGTRAEWRIAKAGGKAVPVALIVRVNAVDQSDPEHPKRVPLLAVARIARDAACVVRTVDARAPDANEQARQVAADRHIACLPGGPDSNPTTKG
ncbi:hypothetical protein GCM10027277_51940 [Pseudoduganella ginsengisoli]|uniref:Uncharacterized protein n=1 Tax=Pseudoduganella ginsengisoli TaxID=1462440 RepID=A0A6L6Q3I4_9BURK|nr:hypothetical protein [Pseudoduganella ginsengisoli]MTW04413.1 hypothetical protein [Pseudoduganella ginsengisoli]